MHWKTFFLLSTFLMTNLFAFPAHYKSGRSYSLAATDSLQGDLFFGGRFLNVAGLVKGDVIGGSQDITIKGKVSDDVYAWAEEIRIEGQVGDLFLGFGKEIIIKGKINGDVIAYGGSVRIMDGAEIFGNIYVGTALLEVGRAKIHGTVSGGAAKADLNGTFDKDINLSISKIAFGPGFSTPANVVLTLKNKPAHPFKNAPTHLIIKIKPAKHFLSYFSFFWFLISGFVIGLLLMILFRPLYDNIALFGLKKFLPSIGLGALFIVITPIIILLAVIVLPLAFILGALYFITLYLGHIFTSYILAEALFTRLAKNTSRYLKFAVALLLIALLVKIPVVGFLLYLFALALGSGTFIFYLYRLRKNGTAQA